jgi:hypothetical protein
LALFWNFKIIYVSFGHVEVTPQNCNKNPKFYNVFIDLKMKIELRVKMISRRESSSSVVVEEGE